MNDAKSTTNNNVPATKQEQLGFIKSMGYIIKGAYTAPVAGAVAVATVAEEFVQHKDDFRSKTKQALNMMFDGVETTLDTLQAAQIIARKNLYGVDNLNTLKGMSDEDRVNLIVKKMEGDNE